ncbi:hypothetical protein AB4152_06750 [Vibrio breoganii]|uniref:hypothetical protein n=1 Tax=Vibrio breoganii TaxID=553239 RepID=UPI0014820125|nr:hypothetical protein [Vibrio breoganii]MDN3718021.1 hypothetical protein [Vibrio breoganii]
MNQMFLENRTEEAFIEELHCNARECCEVRYTYAIGSLVERLLNRLSNAWASCSTKS